MLEFNDSKRDVGKKIVILHSILLSVLHKKKKKKDLTLFIIH